MGAHKAAYEWFEIVRLRVKHSILYDKSSSNYLKAYTWMFYCMSNNYSSHSVVQVVFYVSLERVYDEYVTDHS